MFPIRSLPSLGLMLLLCGCGAAPSEQSNITASGLLDALKGPTVAGVDDTMAAGAREAEAAGNYQRASSIYQQMLDKKPGNFPVKLAYANALRRTGKCNDALPQFEAVLAKEPASAEALEGKGLCQMNLGDSRQAADTFTAALAADPNRWRSLNAVGILFAAKGKTDEAIAYFERAQQTDGTQIAVMNNLALAYLLDKRYGQAIETFTSAQRHLPTKSPEKARIDLNLSLAYALSGDMEMAQRVSAPHLSEAEQYNNMGFYAKLAKDENLARDYLNMALSKSPTFYRRAQANLDTVPRSQNQATALEKGVKVKRLHIPGKPYQNQSASAASAEPKPSAPYQSPYRELQPGQIGAPATMPEQKPTMVKGLSEDAK